MKEEDKHINTYLKGYKEGFESALKIAWAFAIELHIKVNNENKQDVQEFIDKIKS